MNTEKRRGVLAYKLLFLILVCSSIITLMATLFQLATTYQSGIAAISSQLDQVRLTHTNSLSKSLWIFDTSQLNIEMDGILNYPDINYVEIRSNGETVINKGKSINSPAEERTIPLKYQTKLNEIELGTLYIQANDKNVKDKVREQVAVILISQGVKTFIVSTFILFIINLLITKHLEKIASYAKKVSVHEGGDLDLDRSDNEVDDELDILVNAINSMRTNLQRAYADLQTESNERKVAKDELFKQANLLENIINGIPAYIYWRDLEGNYLGCNELYATLTGLHSKEIIGKGLEEIGDLHPHLVDFHQLDSDVINSFKAKWNKEIVVEMQKDNQSYYVQSVVPMYSRNREVFGVLGLFIDVSPKKKAENEKEAMKSQVLRSAKMASIGELASGIGHEINNPLAIIQGNLELLESYLDSSGHIDDEMEKLLQNQMVAINRIRGIVDGLRVFAREDGEKKEVVEFHEALEETYKLIENLYINEGIEVALELQASDSVILGNRNKMQQAVLNLISNAKDAVLEKESSGKFIKIKSYNHERNFVVEVSDNGVGMDEEVQKKIFDSYFTTKPAGEGTGIGLDLSKSIVETFGGKIDVKSEPGVGTTFKVSFPLTSEFGKRTVEKLESKFNGKVLIVDDDSTVRTLIRKHLEGLGFEAAEAGSGPEAMNMMADNDYSGLFTDMRMPGMSGVELLQNLSNKGILPNFKVLVTGGLDEQAEVNELLDGDLQFDLVLNKPFSRRELARNLKLLLESA